MFMYGWYKAGYLEERPPRFLTPFEFCFDHTALQLDCESSGCISAAFIRCSWCKTSSVLQGLCFSCTGRDTLDLDINRVSGGTCDTKRGHRIYCIFFKGVAPKCVVN